jgi:hypothetical protein
MVTWRWICRLSVALSREGEVCGARNVGEVACAGWRGCCLYAALWRLLKGWSLGKSGAGDSRECGRMMARFVECEWYHNTDTLLPRLG